MVDFFLYTTLSCSDADSIMLRMRRNNDLNAEVKIELVEVLKESTPECPWDAKGN